MTISLVVTDASPLITLALADRLDVLLLPQWPIAVPDAVYNEAVDPRFVDGRRIGAWINDNAKLVRIESTRKGIQQTALRAVGMPARDFGELSAIEVCGRHLQQSRSEEAILLYEDADLRLLRAAINPRIKLLTTGSFLAALQANGRIQSATEIIDAAELAGRNMQNQRGESVDPNLAAALNERLDRLYGPRE